MDTKHLPQCGMRRGGPVAALPAALLVVALISAAAPAGPAEAKPATPPPAATQPAEEGISVTISGAPAAGATTAAKVKSMADRLTITDMEKTVLDAARDDTKQIDETGLYVALGVAARAAGNVQLDPQEWPQLDRPAYVSLLAEPKLWRARPLQATATIYRVTKLMSGEGLNYSDFWPKDRTAWRMDGVLSDPQAAADQPVIILSVVNPAEFLGQGEPVPGTVEMEYKRGSQIRVAAIFYKNLIDTDRNGAVRAYPIVMAWQLGRTDMSFAVSGGQPDGLMTRMAPVVILLAALAGGFYLLRRRMTPKRQDGGVQGPRYQPLRSPPTTASSPKEGAANPEDVYVDPELAAAVEQYRHEKGHDETEGTTGAAGKNRHG